jgi:predicted Zn-dependent peptidase
MQHNAYQLIENTSDVFHIYVYFPVGSVHENQNEKGVSHFLEHILFKNKGEISKDLSQSMTEIGARYNAGTSKDMTYFYIKSNSVHYKTVIQLMHQMVTRTNFTDAEVDIERKVVIEERMMGEDLFDTDFSQLCMRTIMSDDNSYLYPIIGKMSVLRKVTAKDLKTYFDKHYKNMFIMVNCDKKIKHLVEKEVENIFRVSSTLDNDQKHIITNIEPKIICINKPLRQYVVRLSFETFPATLKNENIILDFVNYCLTGAMLYSILYKELRGKRGLIYGVSSMYESFRHTGFFYIQTSSSNSKTDYIVSVILNMLKHIKTGGIPGLEYYRKSYLNIHQMNMKNEDIRTETFGVSGFYGITMKENDISNTIKNMTQKDIKRVCKQCFDFDKLGVICMGKWASADSMGAKIQDMLESY